MRGTRLLVALCLLSVIAPRALPAQRAGALAEESEIGIDAEQISYEQKTNTIVASGNVVIRRGDTELRADEVRLNRATNQAEAHGHVVITDTEGAIFADAIELNLDEETGSLHEAKVQSRRYRYSLWGDRIEKGVGQTYHIENGRFTTCHCTEGAPSWSISGHALDVDLGGYGRLRGGTFNILDQPVLYIPRAVFPVQRDRQSGFLLPRLGFSNTRGFQTLLPFYWAINKSQDATLALDVETSARAGLVGEYRYALSRDTRGEIDASYFNESFRGGTPVKPFETSVPEDRWSVVAEHRQPLTGTSQAYADVFVVSDDLFLRDINTYAFEHAHDVAIRTLPFTQSRAGVVQLWDRAAVKAEGTYYQNLKGNEAQTLQRAPEIDLWGQSRLGGSVLGQLAASAVDFQRGHGADGFRLDVEPAAIVPLPIGRFGFGALRASLRETAYHLTEDRLVDKSREVSQNQSRELFQVGAELGTTLNRVYPVHWWGLEKLKHTLEPQVSYLYIPAVAQGDLPIFDGIDRVNHRNLLTYGLVSRVIGKFADEQVGEAGPEVGKAGGVHAEPIRELGRVSVMQSFDVSRGINPPAAARETDHFSDIDLDGRINPSRFLSVRFHSSYDAGNNTISATKVGLFVEDPRASRAGEAARRLDIRTSAGVSYRYLTQNQLQVLQEVDDNIAVRLTDWAGFFYSSRYDVVTSQFLDNFFALRFISTCDCWALDLAVTDRTNPQEVEFRVQLTLAGLGSTKRQRGVAAAP